MFVFKAIQEKKKQNKHLVSIVLKMNFKKKQTTGP